MTSAADAANIELTAVKDPDALGEDLVRKQQLDTARELIAKRLRPPLVGTAVKDAQSEIAGFLALRDQLNLALESRPDQVITCPTLALTHGEPLSKLGAAVSSGNQLKYFDVGNGNAEVDDKFVLNAGARRS